jgi:NAD-dependent DNA ligase
MHYCINASCPAQFFEALKHFVGVMDVEGMGEALVRSVIDAGLAKDVADLYAITQDGLMGLERMGEKSSAKVIAAIQASKRRPLEQALFVDGESGVHDALEPVGGRRFDAEMFQPAECRLLDGSCRRIARCGFLRQPFGERLLVGDCGLAKPQKNS